MTTVTEVESTVPETTRVKGFLSTAARVKVPVLFAIFAIGAVVLFVPFARQGSSPFILATPTDFFALPTLVVPAAPVGVAFAVLIVICTVISIALAVLDRRTPLWLIVIFAVLVLAGFLVWADAGAATGITVPLLLLGGVSLATPLIYGALGGVLSERSGVVNVAIEGQLLGGAFVSALVASAVAHPLMAVFGETDLKGGAALIGTILGLIAAAMAGVLVSFLLSAFGIKYLVDQVIVGVVLNVLVTGITSFLYTAVLSNDAEVLNSPPLLQRLPIPGLSQIPIIGPVLFNGTIITYVMYVAIFLVWFFLFKTRGGLRVRAVGEHPKAADTVGIKVNRKRFSTVAIAGAIAGFGGAFFTLGSVGGFTKEVTAGAGFIALAAVIFGRWDPLRATLAGLLFGFATELQYVLSSIGSPVPGEFMRMVPYIATVLAVAGLVGTSRAPAADGKPYVK